jgi:predicted TIM-barrel fold metal-dependent hydrolase
MLESLRALDISESDRAGILGGNAARLLGLGPAPDRAPN